MTLAALVCACVLGLVAGGPVAGLQDAGAADSEGATGTGDAVSEFVDLTAVSEGERAAAEIRGAVRDAAARRVAAAQAGDAEALAGLMAAEEAMISRAVEVQLAGSELDTAQFEHRESLDEFREARQDLNTHLATLYTIGPIRTVDVVGDVDGDVVVAVLSRKVLLESVFAGAEKRMLDAFLATEIDVDIRSMAAERRAAEDEMRALRQSRVAASADVAEASAILDALAALPDDVVFPIAGDHNFIDTFLAPRMYGSADAHRHQGTDVFAAEGTPLVAMERGIVVRIGQIRLGGNRFWLIGESGARYYYAHLSGFAEIEEGQFVEAGTVVGYVGNTGNARTTPPHLHIQVHPDGGRAVNPYPLLRQLADRDAGLIEAGGTALGALPPA
ncbi:MAG: M23 family metallopeptidase [Actinomycetia bacterium]|nr:M23 family metallopeptidase [Actinomycetes bacterium]MCP4958355.1 M23 family metallopeptidase [Actinomycetes bacterium]